MKYRDYYEVLGVPKDATQSVIKKAFHKLAKQHHPDATSNNKVSEERFKEVSEAYEVLGDEKKRKKYDEMGREAAFSNGSDFDPSRVWRTTRRTRTNDASENDFSDFFNAFFGGGSDNLSDMFDRGGAGGRHTRSRAQDGGLLEADVSISLREAYNGTERKVTVRGGASDRTISFQIPAGVMPEEKIRLTGQGGAGSGGGKAGDLLIRVMVAEDARYKLNGMDLEMALDLMPWQAALGFEARVETLEGNLLVKTPPGIQTDGRIRVTGRGYRDRKGKQGDLYLRIRIMNPKTPDKELMDLYQSYNKQA